MIELMIALCVSSLFITSAVSLVSGSRVLGVLAEMRNADISVAKKVFSFLHSNGNIDGLDDESAAKISRSWYGDNTSLFYSTSSTISVRTTVSDMTSAYGASSCSPFFPPSSSINSVSGPGVPPYTLEWLHPSFGAANYPTDVQVRHGIGYVTVDSAVQARDDVFVFDFKNSTAGTSESFVPIGSLHTGPGAEALAVAGHYMYVANMSATNQLQVIDISNKVNVSVAARLKLPLPYASSSAPAARSIFYRDGRIYLGTEKWDGLEFAVIDVSYPPAPVYLGGYEIGSAVNNISVRDGRAYLAVADGGRFVVLDVSDPMSIRQIDSFSPAGGSIESGNRVLFHHDEVWFGRSGGGFNTNAYKELYRYGSSTSFTPVGHVVGGVRGIAVIEPYVFVAAGEVMIGGAIGGEVGVWKYGAGVEELIGTIPLGAVPVAMSCDGTDLYVVLEEDEGIIRIRFDDK